MGIFLNKTCMECFPNSIALMICVCSTLILAQCRPSVPHQLPQQSEVKVEAKNLKEDLGVHKSMAITIDDLPGINLDDYEKVTDEILNALNKHNVKAVGFVNEGKLYKNGRLRDERLQLLEKWLEKGQDLGNHTFSHPDYNKLSFEAFTSDLLRGEKHTRDLLEKYGHELRYFRHPFLHKGNTDNKKQKLEAFLLANSYISAPVSVDNSEWIFAKAYHVSLRKNDEEEMKRVGEAYVEYMVEMTKYYERQAYQLLDTSMNHILLIHANALNGAYLDKLLEAYRIQCFQFISLEKALSDPAYDLEDQYVGNGGISWIHRWAITRGVDKSFFVGEPQCPEFVQEIAGIE